MVVRLPPLPPVKNSPMQFCMRLFFNGGDGGAPFVATSNITRPIIMYYVVLFTVKRNINYDISMSRQRRNWTLEEKAAIVLEIIREEGTLAEISRKYDIAQPVLSWWRADKVGQEPCRRKLIMNFYTRSFQCISNQN